MKLIKELQIKNQPVILVGEDNEIYEGELKPDEFLDFVCGKLRNIPEYCLNQSQGEETHERQF